MNILGISGSPHENGNTAILIKALLEGAKEAGHSTELFQLSKYYIGPLISDETSSEKNRYEVTFPSDDMIKLYPYIEKMNAIIIGSPIYYDHITGMTKNFLDRLYYYRSTHSIEHRKQFPSKVKAITIITYEWGDPDAYKEVIEWLNGRLKQYFGMEIIRSLRVEDTFKRPVSDRTELIKLAHEIGHNL